MVRRRRRAPALAGRRPPHRRTAWCFPLLAPATGSRLRETAAARLAGGRGPSWRSAPQLGGDERRLATATNRRLNAVSKRQHSPGGQKEVVAPLLPACAHVAGTLAAHDCPHKLDCECSTCEDSQCEALGVVIAIAQRLRIVSQAMGRPARERAEVRQTDKGGWSTIRSPVSWALLGLVIERPDYGYGLVKRFQREYSDVLTIKSDWHVYRALDGLRARSLIEQVDLVNGEALELGGRQPKPHYRVTGGGFIITGSGWSLKPDPFNGNRGFSHDSSPCWPTAQSWLWTSLIGTNTFV